MAHRDQIREIVGLLHKACAPAGVWPEGLREDEAVRLAALLRAVPVLELASLEWSISHSYVWPPLDAKHWLQRFEARSSMPGGWARCAISTLDRSGFVRQAAVEAFRRETPLEAVPFVVLRTADRVPQVRAAAEKVLDRCLKRVTPTDLLPSLEVALYAEARVGADRLAGARTVLERVRNAPDEVLVAGVEGGARRTQHWCLRQLAARRSKLLAHAAHIALRSSSAALRCEGAALLGQVPAEFRSHLLGTAFADRVGFIRRAAAEAVPAQDFGEDELERLLLDLDRGVRAVAQREWLRRRQTSAAGFYRDHLGAPRKGVRAAALSGLAELGEQDDAAEAVVRLEDRSWRVRLMSLRCISRLAPAEAEAAALGALGDSSLKVVRAAASIALRHPSPSMQAQAEQLIFSADRARRTTGLRLLCAGDPVWQAEMLDKLLRSSNAAQAEVLPILDKLVTRRLLGRPLPPALRDGLIAAVTASSMPPEVDERGPHDQFIRRRHAEKLRDRILFGLRSAPTR